jgi:hypothetical protein
MFTDIDARDQAIELVEDGTVSAKDMLVMALKYMSTDDVADMLDCNELSDRFLEEEDDGQPTEYEEWMSFDPDC